MSFLNKRHSLPHSQSHSSVSEALSSFQRRKSSAKVSFQSSLSSPKEEEEFSVHHSEDSQTKKTSAEPISQRRRCSIEAHNPPDSEPISPLSDAIRKGDLELFLSLLNEDAIHEIDREGCNAMHYAASAGNTQIMEILLERGCDPTLSDRERCTPLHKAVSSGKLKAVSFLLQVDSILLNVKDKRHGRTPLHYAALLPAPEIIKVLLEKLNCIQEKEEILRMPDRTDGRTALHLASYEGFSESVGILLSDGADANDRDNEGLTPMHLALQAHRGKRKCGKVLSLLLESGGDINSKDERNSEGLAHLAARVGCVICLRFLHGKGVDIRSKNLLGQTPLHIAAYENKSEATMFIVTNGADLEALDHQDQRPLHSAIQGECPNIIDKLVSSGVDINATDSHGCSYVQFALTRKRIQSFQALVRANATNLPLNSGEDILHYCSALGSLKAVSFLLEQGWDINIKDNKGRTALHRALNHGHEPLATMLINSNADPCILDDSDASPLHYAVRWGGSDAILRLLMKRKAKLGGRDRLGRTPLHYAASKFSVMSDLYILLGGGSDLNAKDNMGLTPLHLAARMGNESLVRILLDNGAKHDIADVDNFLPIDHAKEKNNKNIIKRLENHHLSLLEKKQQQLDPAKKES